MLGASPCTFGDLRLCLPHPSRCGTRLRGSTHHRAWKMAAPASLSASTKSCSGSGAFIYSPVCSFYEKALMIILGFVVVAFFLRLGWGWGQEMEIPCHTSVTCQPRSLPFSPLLGIAHSFGQIWWRGQFWDLAPLHTVFTWKLFGPW